jgi:D-serine dehydratase
MAWFAALAPYVTAGSAAMSAGQQYSQGIAQKNISEYNAKVSEQEQKTTLDQYAREEEATRRETSQALAKQRAAIAESGAGSGGSNGMLADQSAVLAELDALNTRYTGAIRGAGLLSQARQYRLSGSAAAKGGGLLAGASLLSGASDTYKSYRLSQQGVY